MYVYAQLGISLPHYTVAQWNATLPISSPEPGDLVFFNGLGHVGIYIGGGSSSTPRTPAPSSASTACPASAATTAPAASP